MKRAEPHEFTAFLLEQHVLADYINNVGPLLDGLDRAGMETGQGQGLAGEGGRKLNAPDMGLLTHLFCRTTPGVGALRPQANQPHQDAGPPGDQGRGGAIAPGRKNSETRK